MFYNFLRAFVEAINRTHFQGVSGNIAFDGSDRIGALTIQQIFSNETITVGHYEPQTKSLTIHRDLIRWLSTVGPSLDLIDDGNVLLKLHLLAGYFVFIFPFSLY